MTHQELLEVIETASRIIREEIEEKTQLKAEKKQRLKIAAEEAISDYEPGEILNNLWSSDSDDYYSKVPSL